MRDRTKPTHFCKFSDLSDFNDEDSFTTDTLDSSAEMPLQDCSSPTVEEVMSTLLGAGWDFSMLRDSATITTNTEVPKIAHTRSGIAPSWDLNYPALVSLMNGQYYVEYHGIFGMMGTPVMSEVTWNKVIGWLGKNVKELADISCNQVRQKVVERGEKFSWVASYDGFYLTRGHHSNNSSGTLHDVASDKIAWFSHRTKRGTGANWVGTSSGAEGDMLREILDDVKANGFTIKQIIMDHDTSGANIACTSFPEVRVTYCGNHTAKSFHSDLTKIKSVKCKVIYFTECWMLNVYVRSAHHHVKLECLMIS